MKFLLLISGMILILSVILLIGCGNFNNNVVDLNKCLSDDDCIISGCSNHICGLKNEVQGIITTCEFKQEYACLRLTECGCIDGKCQWIENNEYLECMKNISVS